jgi:hypothetical protein
MRTDYRSPAGFDRARNVEIGVCASHTAHCPPPPPHTLAERAVVETELSAPFPHPCIPLGP